MAGKPKYKLVDVSGDGEIRLPPEAIEVMELKPGEQVELFVDRRRKQIRIERHVEDAWSEAMKKKQEKDFEDILSEQTDRENAATEFFEKKLKEPPEPRRPEDNPDLWR
ncbi:MAG: hypothetical protein ACYSX0_12435 [Planctomycetota bacterium]|jgi:bifunctional DNA-binding transcriptional regulator/antitoxin component of YhaV-PrlF toxin-antitoxin module